MALIDTPQVVDIRYKGRRHWFNVWRFTTDIELHAALSKAGIPARDKNIIAYADCYPAGEECGAMYLLDTSVDTLAHEATHMALGILARHGHSSLVVTTEEEPELSHDL